MSGQEVSKTRFDSEAATWDADEKHLDGVEKAFEAIKQHVPAFSAEGGDAKDLDVLEIGCGTGLLSFKLAPHVRSLIGVDTSSGMLATFSQKISALSTTPNLAAVNVLVQDPDDKHLQAAAADLAARRPNGGNEISASNGKYRFDLVVSHLTLHHIPDMAALCGVLHKALRKGGCVALTDYEDFGNEARAFHPKAKWEGVERHGVRKDEIEMVMRAVGFEDVRIETPFVMQKKVEGEDGSEVERDFPFLLCFGRKG
ncbi:unnamed protein product [Periconia digitata]|uniref:S-adenosyl-L-methionine-dependent methyltransferase n=1 Tax=Periconia digitata TaxID=1303443 RepID=A0A9W4U6Z2_9PLEO|nr:unnamed protein product [Periconia digitata]